MSESTSSRIDYIDVARGIAIICIILGHFGINSIDRVVFTFHVPLFFLISGYFIDEKSEFPIFLKKKLRTLMLPYLTTSAIVLVISVSHELFDGKTNLGKHVASKWLYAALYGSGNVINSPFYIPLIGPIWFLPALFWGSLFFRIILKLPDKFQISCVAVMFLAGMFTARYFWLPMSIQSGMCSVFFMYSGYLYRKNKNYILSVTNEMKTAFVILSFIIWIAFIYNFRRFGIVHCEFGKGTANIISSVFSSIFACCCVLILSYVINKYLHTISRFLSFAGQYSIIVLSLHTIELDTFRWYLLSDYMSCIGIESETIHFAVIMIIKLSLIFILTFILSHFKLTKIALGMNVSGKQASG